MTSIVIDFEKGYIAADKRGTNSVTNCYRDDYDKIKSSKKYLVVGSGWAYEVKKLFEHVVIYENFSYKEKFNSTAIILDLSNKEEGFKPTLAYNKKTFFGLFNKVESKPLEESGIYYLGSGGDLLVNRLRVGMTLEDAMRSTSLQDKYTSENFDYFDLKTLTFV